MMNKILVGGFVAIVLLIAGPLVVGAAWVIWLGTQPPAWLAYPIPVGVALALFLGLYAAVKDEFKR